MQKAPGSDSFRIIYDGARRVRTNRCIRVREWCTRRRSATCRPSSPRLKSGPRKGPVFCVAFDARRAHRAVPVRAFQALAAYCIPGEDDHLWVNWVGARGLASATYLRWRAAAALVRKVHYAQRIPGPLQGRPWASWGGGGGCVVGTLVARWGTWAFLGGLGVACWAGGGADACFRLLRLGRDRDGTGWVLI